MKRRRRKRCPYCHKLFTPDLRVAKRQWACGETSCQGERRRETQRRYRHKHPEDAQGRRIRAQLAAAKSGAAVPTPRGPPAALDRFPWEELRDEMSPQVMVMMAFLVRLLVAVARDVMQTQEHEIAGKTGNLGGAQRKDETAPLASTG